jgi:hypothetical protein
VNGEERALLLYVPASGVQERPTAVPVGFDWPKLLKRQGDDLPAPADAQTGLFDHYRHSLRELGRQKGLLGQVRPRAEAIVSKKHRGSYDKAAELLTALAEVHASRGDPERGQGLLQTYWKNFNRHSAFRRELKSAAEKSGIFEL